jgi:choline dehydrogenase-like flavoprotein
MSAEGTYDLAVVGSSFAASFFLHGWLKHAPRNARAIVLERGAKKVHGELINLRMALRRKGQSTFRRGDDKPWWYAPVVGGTSNVWFGNTPRMRPDDFELKTRYGQGLDWPLSYDELEPYYAAAEELMHVAGPSNSPVPRSTPYPQPAHELSDPELLLAKAWPDHFSACPTARASRQVPGGRGPCCTSFKCNTCPVDAKFTVLNGLASVYADPRVTLRPRSTVLAVNIEGGSAKGVVYRTRKGGVKTVRADVVALAANALFNPHILSRSGLGGGAVGRYLNEQVGISGHVDLEGVDGYQGGTSCTGHHELFWSGAHRAERAGFLLETYNTPVIRLRPGRWRQRIRVVGVYEDLPSADSKVSFEPLEPDRPVTTYAGHSDYAQRGVDRFLEDVETVFASLPVEKIEIRSHRPTEGHILGTARMGTNMAESVVDADQVHHLIRNLLCLGGSSFPTSSPANPSLTISALSLRSADRYFGP